MGASLPSARATRGLAAQRADLAFEVSNAGLARVTANHLAKRLGRELDVLGREAVVLDLLGHEVFERDHQLLFLGVAGDLEDFHAVAQRWRDRDRARWPS